MSEALQPRDPFAAMDLLAEASTGCGGGGGATQGACGPGCCKQGAPEPPVAAALPADEAPLVSDARRGFLSWLATVAAWITALFALRGTAMAAPRVPASNGPKRRWGMVIDLDKCTRCGGCVTACRSENNVPYTGRGEELQGTEITWMAMLNNSGEARIAGLGDNFPTPCMHCEDPPCIKVCPVGATYADEEGLVHQIWDRCIGCRYCESACPYSRRYFNWHHPEWPESYLNLLNPDVATRAKGVVEKCTFCVHRIRKVKETARREERPITDEDVRRLPACAQACPADAITFGDLDDPHSEVARLEKDPRAERLLEHVGTRPKVIYLRDRGDTL